jgi:hypothetical protein
MRCSSFLRSTLSSSLRSGRFATPLVHPLVPSPRPPPLPPPPARSCLLPPHPAPPPRGHVDVDTWTWTRGRGHVDVDIPPLCSPCAVQDAPCVAYSPGGGYLPGFLLFAHRAFLASETFPVSRGRCAHAPLCSPCAVHGVPYAAYSPGGGGGPPVSWS